jgi:hypothetical protein
MDYEARVREPKRKCVLCGKVDGNPLRVAIMLDTVFVKRTHGSAWRRLPSGTHLCPLHPRVCGGLLPAQVMTSDHPRWQEFYGRLEGPEGCNFREKVPGDPTTVKLDCTSKNDHTNARKILSAMGFNQAQVDSSCEYFNSCGGFCDCEVLFNVKTHRPRRRSR